MKKLYYLIIAIIVLSLGATVSYAETTLRSANVTEINGSAEVLQSDGSWKPATVGMILGQGDAIRTRASSWAMLSIDGLTETATVEVKENSELKLATLLKDDAEASQTTLLDLSLGEILIKAKKLHSETSKFEVKTPTSIVGVRGTTFSVAVEAVE